MPSHLSPRSNRVAAAAIVASALLLGSTAAVAAGRPSKPASGVVTIQIAATGSLEPSRQYANVDVTVTCPVGWTWHHGYLSIVHGSLGGSGTFSAACTGTPQVAHSRVVNGNGFQLGDWTGTAAAGITRNGQQVTATTTRTVQLQPSVAARIADQGQLTGTSGGGVALAVAVGCPSGGVGQVSSVSVNQGTASGQGAFTPTCDGQTRSVVVPITASQGAFHTGGASAQASVHVSWNGSTFSGADARAISILESSTGDTTPPTAPSNLSANVFSDGETWLSWGTSSDNATPAGRITYEVDLNGGLDQPVGPGSTQAILYAELGRVNTIEVVAVDGAGNRSAPATVTVDCSGSFCH